MIRVVQVVEDLEIGGQEKVIENITMHLNPVIFKVSVLCLSRGGKIANELAANGQDVEILGIKNYHNPLSFIKVAKWFKENRTDIVHTHAYPAGVLGRSAAVIAGVPCIFHHVHTLESDYNTRNHFISGFLGRFTSKVICCSGAVKNFVSEKTNIVENKVIVLYNGIPEPTPAGMPVLDELKEKLVIPGDSGVIGCVASLEQPKGHRYLLEAFTKVGNAYLLLVGDGSLRRSLEGMASELGIGNRIIFAGRTTDVVPYLQLMDIAVLPSSEREGLGISLIEAMAMSKPVIATNTGGIPEVVVDKHTGVLVAPRDSKALADAINGLLKSPDLMRKYGANGRKRYLDMFTIGRMTEGVEALYAECRQNKT